MTVVCCWTQLPLCFLWQTSYEIYLKRIWQFKAKRIIKFILVMCFKVTFTHCPYQRHLACQQKQSDVRWQPKHTAYAHTIIAGLCMCDLVSFLFYSLIKPKDLCPI